VSEIEDKKLKMIRQCLAFDKEISMDSVLIPKDTERKVVLDTAVLVTRFVIEISQRPQRFYLYINKFCFDHSKLKHYSEVLTVRSSWIVTR
jgi:hypothetical protein